MVNSKQRGILFGKTFMQALICNYSEYSIRSSLNASAKRNQAPTSPPPPPRLLALNFGLSRKLGTMTHSPMFGRTVGPGRIAQMSTTRRPAGNRCRSQTEIADSAASKMQRHRARDAFQTPRCVFIINRPLGLFCSVLDGLGTNFKVPNISPQSDKFSYDEFFLLCI